MRVDDEIEWLSNQQSEYGPSICKIVGWDDEKIAISSPDQKAFNWFELNALKIYKLVIGSQGVYRWILY